MTGVEIDFVVADSLEALALYEKIFEVEVVEKTNYEKGLNEVIFTVYGTRFHMLDENPAYELVAPQGPQSIWFNVMVPDIRKTFDKAVESGCQSIQPVTELTEMGVLNGMFTDPFGYVWLLHEIVREVSFEERQQVMMDHIGKEKGEE